MSCTDLPRRADVVVVGGGIAGAADAFFLAKSGAHVVLLEKAEQLASLTTARSAACYRAQWHDAAYADLVVPSIRFYENFATETGLRDWDIGLRAQGWLFVTRHRDGPRQMAEFVSQHRKLSIQDSEYLSGDQIRQRFSWIAPTVTAGSFRASDGWLSPYEVTRGFAQASGASIHKRVSADAIETHRGRVTGVRTNCGRIQSPRVVVAAGPYSSHVAATASVSIPVTQVRRHLLWMAVEVPLDAPMVLDTGTGVYWRPDGSGAIVGQGQDEPPGRPTDHVPTDWTFPPRALMAASDATPFWYRVAASLKRDQFSLMAGQYTCTNDGLPLIGETGQLRGLYFHTGDNGWGVESAPAAARLLANLVVSQRRSRMNPYSVDRSQTHSLVRATY